MDMHCDCPERHSIVALCLVPYSIKPIPCNYLLSSLCLQQMVSEPFFELSGANVNQASPDTLLKAPKRVAVGRGLVASTYKVLT